MPSNASVGALAAATPPEPVALSSGAAPRLLSVRFSSLDVKRGERWSGAFVTSTNVASVEVRTPLFSINVPRSSFGRFGFAADVLDLPPIFVRPYRLEVIARNTAGSSVAEDLPFRIR